MPRMVASDSWRSLRNVRLEIEYDGTDYFGWQRQLTGQTIQAVVEDALASVLGHPVTVYGASRTDSGVHACGQVANFFSEGTIPPERFRIILNTLLPATIRILKSSEVSSHFHAQRDAISKVYAYRILNRSYPSALDRRVYFYPRKLNWKRIQEALPFFIGERDFKAFQATNSQTKTSIRRIHSLDLELESGQQELFRFVIEGDGFLKQMVRTIVGTLLEVGEGKRSIDQVRELFYSRKRELAGRTVPAGGLHLVQVKYSMA